MADALPQHFSTTCVPPDQRERKLFELAATAIELTRSNELSSLDLGATKFLSETLIRKDSVGVCTPDDVLMRVTDALAARGGFGPGSLTEHRLNLAGILPRIDSWLIDSVGKAAFDKAAMPSEHFSNTDIRPRARTILAKFGASAKQFSQIAYEQMSGEDPLGTGAAQVAAATGHPDTLPRIENLMEGLLASAPKHAAIPFNTQARLYELSWALYFAGLKAKQHTAPIHKILQRKVQSWAPPFGMIDVDPTEFCGLLAGIEEPTSTEPYPFCAGTSQLNIRRPRN